MAFASSVSATSCCSLLSHALSTLVSYPGQTDYNLTASSYWSLQESEIKPACIVHPSNSHHVAQGLAVIFSVDGCEFAIKGQGHNPNAGSANIPGGVLIDMTNLSLVELSNDKSKVAVGAGASWLKVYQALDSSGVSVAGGRNGLVGVGGLLLGGGISHFSARVGWACDNVVNYEVVLANGSLVNANLKSHPDLYRALKGGTNNFGIVTRFDLDTFSQGNISSTVIRNEISQRSAVFKAFTDITSAANFDTYTSLVTGLLYNSTSRLWSLSSTAVYTKPDPSPLVFAGLSAIPSISNATSITSLASLANEHATPPLNWLFATASFKPSTQLMTEIFDTLNSTLYSFNPEGGVVWSVAFEPLAGSLLTSSRTNGGNVLGVSPADKGFVLLISALWPKDSSRKAVDEIAHRTLSLVQAKAQSKGLLLGFEYLNYAAAYQHPLKSYGEANLHFLKGVAKKYDPESVFQKRVPGGFKL